MNRIQQILAAVDNLLEVHDQWEADETAPVQPTAAFEAAVLDVVETCGTGDIPAQCRTLCDSVSRLGFEWERYANGVRTPDYRPVGAFWGAYRGVVQARAHATPSEIKQPEPVYVLVEQKVPSRQIAQCIWGHFDRRSGKYTGPFVSPGGQIDEVKIREEAAAPGKHTTGWVHPEQLERQQERLQSLQTRLGAAARREAEDSPPVEQATVVEMLKEGQFPDVIARVKGVGLDDVLAEARRYSITPAVRPNLAAMRAPHEPGILGADTLTVEPAIDFEAEMDFDAEVELPQDEPQNVEPVIDDTEFIRGLNDGMRGIPEIVEAARAAGRNVTFQQVKAAIRTK